MTLRPFRQRTVRRPARHGLKSLCCLVGVLAALASPAESPGLTPSVMIPMRDGIRLAADLHFPADAGERKWPVILIRTPYDKRRWRTADSAHESGLGMARFFARHGFVVAVQDVRGKHESEGSFSVLGGALTDFSDTADWLARQRWSTGRLGTYGCSYLGEIQIIQATTRHPSLAAVLAQAGSGALGGAQGRFRYFGARNGGAFELAMGLGWFLEYGSRHSLMLGSDVDEETRRQLSPLLAFEPAAPVVNYDTALGSLPLEGLVQRLGGPPSDWDFLLTTPMVDPAWARRGYLEPSDTVDVPGLHVNSWYDFGVRESIATWRHFIEAGGSRESRNNQYLLIGGGTHCANEEASANTMVGARPIGDARFEFRDLYLKWFNRWLKGDRDALAGMPRVRYYLLGKNEWRVADQFPPRAAKQIELHLRSGGSANSLFGDGSLVATLAQDFPGRSDSFVYDPANPVPSLGGPLCCALNEDSAPGAFDQTAIESRADVLVYQTEPLDAPLTVVGPVDLVLFVSSDASDTDFTAKLVDVHPDGRAFNVQEGILRARYREGFDREVFMEPGRVYELTVDLQATANHFGRGHRLRLEVSSSNFPRWDRNLNTGGRNYDETIWRKARNTVHHGGRHPSRLKLWVLAKTGE